MRTIVQKLNLAIAYKGMAHGAIKWRRAFAFGYLRFVVSTPAISIAPLAFAAQIVPIPYQYTRAYGWLFRVAVILPIRCNPMVMFAPWALKKVAARLIFYR